MSNTKTIMGQASNQYVTPVVDITDVFSTYLYDGTGAAQTINNGVDLAGKGGMVWVKSRTTAFEHMLADTETGAGKYLSSNTTQRALGPNANALTSFNSNGFSIGSLNDYNYSGDDIASWTFRKAPKFFDVVTWTGDGSTRNISHNLDSAPGMIIIKRLDSAAGWVVYHRSVGATKYLRLDTTNAENTYSVYFNDTAPTSSVFTVGANGDVNGNGNTYVAYLFAHNNSDGTFGPNYDQDIIKCGTFNSGGSAVDVDVNLGFEPQFVMFKLSSTAGGWYMYDTMRGIVTGGNDALLFANASSAETVTGDYIDVTSTGFKLTAAGWNGVSGPNHDLIYMAIRRGPLTPPTAGTEVFAVHKETSATLNQTPPFLQPAPFAVDFISNKFFGGASSWWSATRLTGARLQFNQSNAETSVSTSHEFDHNDGVAVNGLSGSTNFMGYMWKRAPSFFDAVAYTGNGTTTTIPHNLQVVPELIINKVRNNSGTWRVHHAAFGYDYEIYLDGTAAMQGPGYGGNWGGANPTATHLAVSGGTNTNTYTFISYLFATLAGVSKVGSYTGDGVNGKVIDCGFTSGARFVLGKRTDSASDWYLFDSVRGITISNDPYLALNLSDAEATIDNIIRPDSSGFALGNAGHLNQSGGSFIFYAIA